MNCGSNTGREPLEDNGLVTLETLLLILVNRGADGERHHSVNRLAIAFSVDDHGGAPRKSSVLAFVRLGLIDVDLVTVGNDRMRPTIVCLWFCPTLCARRQHERYNHRAEQATDYRQRGLAAKDSQNYRGDGILSHHRETPHNVLPRL